MHRLAFDTSTPRAVIALATPDGRVVLGATDPDRRHGRELVSVLRDLMREAWLAPKALGALAVGLGPGSYTGLRIGVTAAKTLAYATGARLYGFDSLELFARGLAPPATSICVLSDAQRGDFHAAEFTREAEGGPLVRRGATRILNAAELAPLLRPGTIVTGPGVSRWSAPWPDGVVVRPADSPDPSALLELAEREIADGRVLDPFAAEPIYIRRSAAEDLWTARRQAVETPPPAP